MLCFRQLKRFAKILVEPQWQRLNGFQQLWNQAQRGEPSPICLRQQTRSKQQAQPKEGQGMLKDGQFIHWSTRFGTIRDKFLNCHCCCPKYATPCKLPSLLTFLPILLCCRKTLESNSTCDQSRATASSTREDISKNLIAYQDMNPWPSFESVVCRWRRHPLSFCLSDGQAQGHRGLQGHPEPQEPGRELLRLLEEVEPGLQSPFELRGNCLRWPEFDPRCRHSNDFSFTWV